MKRAAQCLDQEEVAQPTLETMQKLARLHPQANPPDVDVADTMQVMITAEILVKAFQRRPRGSSTGHQPGHMKMSRQPALALGCLKVPCSS